MKRALTLLALSSLALCATALAGRGGEPACPATLPNRSPAPTTGDGAFPASSFSHGTRRLRVGMYWRGTVAAGLRPDGSVMASIDEDGSISMKVGWWRGVPGTLKVSGSRLDRQSPPLRASVPEGYGPRGFQVTGITFPSVGCWRVVGRVRDARLSFVVRMTKLAE